VPLVKLQPKHGKLISDKQKFKAELIENQYGRKFPSLIPPQPSPFAIEPVSAHLSYKIEHFKAWKKNKISLA
jgi:hypothetical protein